MKFNKEVFFDRFRPYYKQKTKRKTLSVAQANGVDFLLDNFMMNSRWKDVRHVAYALATIAHETAWTFLPIKEYRAKAGSKGRKNQDRYWLSGYYGRGYVQLTWEYNYKKAQDKLGVALVKNPDLALRNDIAFKILTEGMHEGWFTGQKLSTHINNAKTDYKNARKIINGLDKATTLAGLARDFEAMLRAAMEAAEVEEEQSVPKTPPTEEPELEVPTEFDEEGMPIFEDGSEMGDPPAEPGEAAPEDTAKPGEAVVGGRPTDPAKIVKSPPEESISGWRTWPTTITAILGSMGLSVGGLITSISGIQLSPEMQIMVGWIIIVGLITAAVYGIFYLITRAVGTASEKKRVHELRLLELELASRPDRYNVELER